MSFGVCNTVFTLASKVMTERNTLLWSSQANTNRQRVRKVQELSLVVNLDLISKLVCVKNLMAFKCVRTWRGPLHHPQNLLRVCFLVDIQSHSACPWHKLLIQGYCSELEHGLRTHKRHTHIFITFLHQAVLIFFNCTTWIH